MPTWKKILTEADKAADAAAGVANGETGLVTGNAVFDYIDAQNFSTGSGDITAVVAGNGISGGATSGSATVTLDISDSSLTTETAIAQADLIAFSDESATNDPTVNITFSNFEDTIFGNVSGDATVAAGGALTIADNAVQAAMLNNDIVSGLTDIGAAIASTDEFIISDAGTIRRSDISRLTTFFNDASVLTNLANTDVNVSKANLTTVLASYTGDDTLNIGDSGDDTTVVIRGNLQVDGTTTTVNSTTLTVDDKIITAASGGANAAGVGTAGLEIDTSDSTQLPFVGFVDGAGLTEMVVKAEGNTTAFPIAIMEFSNDSTAPSGNAGGVGSFHFDTGDDKLYVRTA